MADFLRSTVQKLNGDNYSIWSQKMESSGSTKRAQLEQILLRGGFPLAKWASNTTQTSKSDGDLAQTLSFGNDNTMESKVLGIAWNANSDSFAIEHTPQASSTISKRTILSGIARLFDPFGWFSPIIVIAKILLQNLWIAKLDWDDPVPLSIAESWNQFLDSLTELESIRVPRWIKFNSSLSQFQLIGFCDASAKAFSAVVYSRAVDASGIVHVNLLMAKSKLALLKTLSIPRLELCGAVLLTKLIRHIERSLVVPVTSVACYTDSKIVLAWLAKPPVTWEVFVANRVSYIQTELEEVRWNHVGSKLNPADLNSRGIAAREVIRSELWWKGPTWLLQEPLPSDLEFRETEVGRRKKAVQSHAVHVEEPDFIAKFSSWSRLLRVTAFMFKFLNNLKARLRRESLENPSAHFLDKRTILQARNALIRSVQQREFVEDISKLRRGVPLSKNSRILSLSPFLDKYSLLRVGGRLQLSTLNFEQKHPLILDKGHLALLLARHTHLNALHAGLQLTLQILRAEFWVLNARNLVKGVVNACVTCTRQKAEFAYQKMGQLPADRCSPGRAFLHVGVDYAGPFLVRASAGRGQKTQKCYVALFVCFATRAIHLELVMSYDTPAFVAAFHRFVSRRGFPDTIYSDNATNFRGADADLKRAFKAALKDYSLHKEFTANAIQWKFIPPSAPHFGGLWEAGVKSVKHHLRRIMGEFKPTCEEFITVLTRIEACLNSRPIARLHDEPDDLQVLTPAHFLTGTSLMSVPEPSVLELNENRLSRWQAVSKIVQGFWKVWSNEYLQTLQVRTKWKHEQKPLEVGELVLMRDPIAPPARWPLGLVKALHPSRDGLVRVATVKLANTELQRPVTQLCRLPVQNAI